MKKLIIIVYGYEGKNSKNANSICLNAIIQYLSEKFDLYIVTSTNEEEIIKFDEINNILIHKIPYELKKNGKINFLSWRTKVVEEISKFEMTSYSKLLTISFPFPVLEVGYELKKKFKHLEWNIYELDPYAYNKILRFPRLLFFYRWYKENKMFRQADNILLTHELYHSYKKTFFRNYLNKFIDIGIPLLEIFDDNQEVIHKKTIKNISYIGSLYSNARNSEYLFKLFSEIDGVTINFYGPDPSEVPKRIKEEFGDSLVVHGRISKPEVEVVLKESDALLNIGNKVNNQLPSKVLEYIGTGKPIINLFSINDDTSNLYLTEYPNALLINENDDLLANKNKLKEFLLNNNVQNNGEKLRKIYKSETTEAVAGRIIAALNKCL